jgi:hypothetical protein
MGTVRIVANISTSYYGFPHCASVKKMTQGWVVYGGMRHAEPQREIYVPSRERDLRKLRQNCVTNLRYHFCYAILTTVTQF